MPQPYSLVPSIRGKIKLIVMVFDQSEPSYISILKELDKKLSAGTQVLILNIESNYRDELLKEKWSKRIIIDMNLNSNFSRWIRDPFITFVKGKETLLVTEFLHNTSSHNQELAEHIDKIYDTTPVEKIVEVNQADWFDAAGGNVLADQKYIFIGWNDFYKTMNQLYLKEQCKSFEECYTSTKNKILGLLNQENSTFEEVIVIGEPLKNRKNVLMRAFTEEVPSFSLFDHHIWKSPDKMKDLNGMDFIVHMGAAPI
ncbi:MAG: hypothetical protein ACKV1O_16840 [Saprospiraceae bacterium]